MKKQSAGLLIYRVKNKTAEVLLVHPGGPFWAKKDKAAWSIPKGELDEAEDLLLAAKREFTEETGQTPPESEYIPLKPIDRGNKTIYAYASEGDYDEAKIISNMFSMEWPPKSGKLQEFSEIDRAEWFDLSTAVTKMHTGQAAFILQLADLLQKTRSDLQIPDLTNVEPKQPTLF